MTEEEYQTLLRLSNFKIAKWKLNIYCWMIEDEKEARRYYKKFIEAYELEVYDLNEEKFPEVHGQSILYANKKMGARHDLVKRELIFLNQLAGMWIKKDAVKKEIDKFIKGNEWMIKKD